MTHVRRLTIDDVDAYVALRTEMLLDSPWAYASSPGDDPACTPEALRVSLAHPEKAILVVDGVDPKSGSSRLVASAGVLRIERFKRRHVAFVWGVYVVPFLRRTGLGRAVVSAAVETARSWPGVECVSLSASAKSSHTRVFYESLGFVAWGVEPDSIRIDGRSYDEVFFQRPLR